MPVATQANRILDAAERYRAGFIAHPEYLTEPGLLNGIRPEQVWAIDEWTLRALELGVITDDEAGTVKGAFERGGWALSADLGLRCAVVQLTAELLGAGL
jgi:hypothetical protein